MKAALLFIAKFAVAAPVCLLLWWGGIPESYGGAMGGYVWVVGQAAGELLVSLFGASITALDIATDGVLNSRSSLTYSLANGHSVTLPIEPLVTNLPSYIALTASTAGLGWKRFGAITASGSLILFATHIVYVTMVFKFGAWLTQWPQLPEILITLPFLLWIVLAHWRHIRPYFSEQDDAEADERESPE